MLEVAFGVANTATRMAGGAASAVGDSVAPVALEWVERSTETVGNIVTPIAENSLVKLATKLPGVKWVMAAVGQVDVEAVHQEVAALMQKYPADTPEQLAQRVIADTATKAAGLGLVSNIAPPIALAMLGIEVAALSALQAEMVYHIAALYGFEPTDPTRRGEVLAIWGLAMGGSSVIKMGLNVVELIPLVGPAVGIAGNAGLMYTLGAIAQQFYTAKRNTRDARIAQQTPNQTSLPTV